MPAVAMLVLAHAADEIIVSFDGASETVTMTADTLAMLAPVDADGDGELTQKDLDARGDALRLGVWDQAKLVPCTRSGESARLEPGYVALKARFSCPPGELSQEFKWLMVLPGTFRVVMDGQIAKGDQRTLHFGMALVPTGTVHFVPLWAVLIVPLVLLGFWLVRRLRK